MNKLTAKQTILITGVSGLVGRILFNYLTNTYPNKYQVYGIDLHTNISSRYKTTNEENLQLATIYPLPDDQFFQCDITDRTKFYEIIQRESVDIIIHLAAVLESEPDLEKISHVNIQGTKNVFEAPGVQRILFASSVMTVFGYLDFEPYRSIYNGTFNDQTMLNNLRKLTVQDDPPLADRNTPGNEIYCQTKIIGEQMAKDILQNNNSSKSIICIRLGWIRIYDQPGSTWLRTVWFSHKDLCQFFDKALNAPLHISGIYFGVSNNHRLWLDFHNATTDLGYLPQDGAEKLQD